MKILFTLALLLLTCGCQIRYTESQLARQRGFTEAQRVRTAEMRADERCFSRKPGTIYCYLLGDSQDSYEVKP